MAGSYSHIVNDDGSLRTGTEINASLECMSGDVVECVTEMYGMIWYLADHAAELYAARGEQVEVEALVELARRQHHIGLGVSPGVVD